MNILITGSNGFIGSYVCRYMKRQGYYAIGMGRSLESRSEVDQYICCDMRDDQLLHICDYIGIPKIDVLIHLAADMRKDPHTVEVVSTNCGGTERLIQLCRHREIPIFIQLSSLPVIGKPKEHPITENHPLDPHTAYHVTKVTEEMLAQFATKSYGIRTVSFRISAPVGIGVNPKTIFPTFVRCAVSGKELVLWGKGTREQTYIHVEDIARAIDLAIRTNAQGVYNLSSNNRLSNLALAKKCVEVTKSSSEIIFSGKADNEDKDIWDVSLKKLQDDTGFVPQVSIEDAILEYAEYLRRN